MADAATIAAVRQLGTELAALHARLARVEASARQGDLKYSSVDGGALVVNDDTGTTRQVIGAQPDGTVTTVEAGGPPPASPAAPIVGAQIGGLVVAWDGLLGGAGPLSDFLWTEVHVSPVSGFTPGTSTLKRTMTAGGVVTVAGLTPGTTYYAVLVAVNRSRSASAPSAQTAGVPLTTTQTIPAGSITPGLLSFSAGGQTVSVGGTAPATPAANDLWFDTGNGGVLKQWSGSAWTAYQFGTGAFSAGSITTPLIAAGAVAAAQILAGSITGDRMAAHTLTADLFQAGIVIANIIDGTVVTGTTVQNSSSNPRTSINPDGSYTVTNAAGTVLFRIGDDGTLDWYDTGGNLLMQLSPGGTQAIYASLTGPAATDFEPPPLAVLFAAVSVASAASYANTVAAGVPAGSAVTVAASCNSATTTATGVTDSKGNTYALVQSQSSASPTQQVFEAVNITALTAADTITVTYSATNTNAKCIIATAAAGVPAATPRDYSAQASGTSTAPSVSGTPTVYGDLVLMIISNGTPAGPSAVPDGWQLAATISTSGTQTTSVYYTAGLATAALTASATLPSSLAWTAVTLGYKPSPARAAAVPTAAALSASTQWAEDGVFSCRVTKVGTAATWGITYPPFPVQPGSYIASRVVIGTLNIALGAVEIGFTFYSGPGGTGTNLGNSFWTVGSIGASAFQALTIFNSLVPPTAQSATFYVLEKQADVAGNWWLVDGQSVPGGLAYSNSPVATTDAAGNPIPQGINFVGLPQLTDVLGVNDPYKGTQLAGIDGQGNISGQQLNAATDVLVAGQSLLNDIIEPMGTGVVARGWAPASTASLPWPATPIGTATTAIMELDIVIPAGRAYLVQVLPTDFIPTVSADTQLVERLKVTTDGSTPTTSTADIAGHSPAIIPVTTAQSGKNNMTPYMEFMPSVPATDTLYRFLLCALIQNGTFLYQELQEIRVTDVGQAPAFNNAIVLGTGTSGGVSPQTYTEHFYGNETWSFNEYGQRNYKGTLYQGAYSGEGFAQHGWIQWSGGDRGNSLNTVLNYTVNKVSLRTLCQHTWYNSGMTVSLHSSSGSVGNLSAISSELGTYTAKAGQFQEVVLGSGIWTPFKAGGVTRMVFRPPGGSLALGYYGYFWGGGNNNSNVPRLTVTYTH